jgi:putative aldouronate transport system substrate-binding protein
MVYRSDWLKKVGLEEPKNVDEFKEMVRAFAEDDPDGDGQNNTVGLLQSNSAERYFTVFAMYFGTGNEWEEDGNGGLRRTFYNDGYIKAMDYLKEMWDEGWLNADYASATKQDLYTYWQAGEGGLFYACLDDAYTTSVKELLNVEPNAEYDMYHTVAGPDGGIRNNTTTGWNGLTVFSTKEIKDEETLGRVLDFFERCQEQDVQELIQYGIEGTHWDLKADGTIELKNQEDRTNIFYDLWYDLQQVDNKRPANYPYLQKKALELMNGCEEYGIMNPLILYVNDLR